MMRVGIVPAKGIGDALLMMIPAHFFHQRGAMVTIFHDQAPALSAWFPLFQFETADSKALFTCDRLILQNDNSERTSQLRALTHCEILYPTYDPIKHPPLKIGDHVFNARHSMVSNLAQIYGSSETGLAPPGPLLFGRYPKRIVLHPLSALPSKNWSASKYRKLAHMLRKEGFDPQFIVSPKEHPLFPEAPRLSSLNEAASFLYESGGFIGNDSVFGHLASLFGHSTLTVAGNAKLIQLWRPGWAPAHVVTPPSWVPNIKGLRLRESRWQSFISPRTVFNTFKFNIINK